MAKTTVSSLLDWRWSPALVGIAGAFATLLIGFAVQERETAAREQLLAARLTDTGEIVETHLETLTQALRRMAQRWEMRARPVHAEWLADAGLYVTHYADYLALLWLDAAGTARWWVARTPNGIATDRTGANVRWTRPLLAACLARAAAGPYCAPAEGSARKHLLITLPVLKNGQVVGHLAGVFDLPRLLSAAIHPDVLPAYTIAILDHDQSLYRRAGREPATDRFQETALTLPGLDWRLRVWPAPGELTHAPSLLSVLILGAGLLMSALLAIMTQLAQKSARRSHELERAVTACAATQATLRRSETRYRAVVEDQSELICRFTPDGVLTFVNPAYAYYFGVSPLELIGKNWLAFLPPEEREDVRRRFQSLTPKNPAVTYQHHAMVPSGEARWQEWTDHAIFDDRGAVVEYQSVGRDITDRRREEERRLKQAAQQRDALVREVHHRIKNNLQGVMGLLRQHLHAHPELAGALEGALTQIHSIATVHGLHSRTPHRRLRLAELVHAVARVTEEIGPVGDAIALALGDAPATELSDSEAVPVALIVNELICNAVKHAADGEPRVEITLTGNDAMTCLRIVNPCLALPPGLDFESGRGLGTGLGLVRSLLPSQGASLRLRHAGQQFEAELCLQPPVIAANVD